MKYKKWSLEDTLSFYQSHGAAGYSIFTDNQSFRGGLIDSIKYLPFYKI